MRKTLLLYIALAFAVLYYVGLFVANQTLMLLTKPWPVLLLAVALYPWRTKYQKIIAIAFIFSALGDLALQLPGDKFVLGLSSFLIAHMFYIYAFVLRSRRLAAGALILSLLLGTGIFLVIGKNLGQMLIPVVLYMVVILVMLWRSYAQIDANQYAKFAFWGALLFVMSDTIIALNRFCCHVPFAQALIMLLYWSAQGLIYVSAREGEKMQNTLQPDVR